MVQIEHVSNLATSLGNLPYKPIKQQGPGAASTLQVQNRLSEAEIERLVSARSTGHTISDLAAEFAIHRTTVMAHLKRTKPSTAQKRRS